MQDVLEELIENFYAEGSEAFLNFVDQYGTGRNDQKIEELILQLYEYSMKLSTAGKVVEGMCG